MKKNKKLPKLNFKNKKYDHEKSILEQVKAARKQSRDEEIKSHGKTLNYAKIIESKKVYKRKKNKADDEHLPYFIYFNLYFNPIVKFLPGWFIPPKSA